MYKYSKDAQNIEEAKKYNYISNQKNKIDTSLYISNATKHNKTQNNTSSNYLYQLDNIAKLKQTCKSFITKNNINTYSNKPINYNAPEILLQEAFLNSQLTLSPIISRKSQDDE